MSASAANTGPSSSLQTYPGDWREAGDPVAHFVAECCVVRPDLQVTISDLKAAYQRWCIQAGEIYPLGPEAFVARMLSRFAPDGSRAQTIDGVGLRAVQK